MGRVIVIGGGAAGMMAAVAAAESGGSVCLIEKNEKLGKKLFITGKGRCNVTNAGDMETLLANVCTNSKFLYSAFYGYDNREVMAFLEREGCPRRPGRLTVGWAVKARKPDKHLLQEVEKCILWLREAYGADSVLIPFYHKEDVGVCAGVAERLGGQAGCLREKYLSEETLSIIGCMDVLVGVRLHSLIYAAVMGVPMIGISYDPKVEAFLASIQRESGFTVKNFCLEGFQKAFRETMENREAIRAGTARSLEELISKLDQNEELIRAIMEQRT